MNVTIQKAKQEDWEIVQQLNFQVFEHDAEFDDDLDLGRPFSPEGILYYKNLTNGTNGTCFIAYVSGNPVGYCALSVKDFGYRKSKYVEVENIGVDPSYRSKGIGQQLLQEAEAWAKKENATRLFVSAYWKNQGALRFYKKNGFTEIGVELDKILD